MKFARKYQKEVFDYLLTLAPQQDEWKSRVVSVTLLSHYLNDEYDAGDVVFQAVCEVLPTDSPADVATKVHALEYEWYPKVVEQLVKSL